MTKGSNFGVILCPPCGLGLRSRRKPRIAKTWKVAHAWPRRLTMSLHHIHNTSHVPGSWGTGRQECALVRGQDFLETAGWHLSLRG